MTPVSAQLQTEDRLQERDLRKTAANPDYWYPLLASKKLKHGKAVQVHFAGEPIVLVRTNSGKLFALEDRCAHRQVPLSQGVITEDNIQCCYHGWTYNCEGHCINVPYVGNSKQVPRGVRSYPCREYCGLIFVFPGDPERVNAVAFPEISSWGQKEYKTRTLDHSVNCHYSFLHENLMDMNHQFLHRRIMSKIKTIFLDLREGENFVEVDYTFKRTGRQPIGEKVMLNRFKDKKDSVDLMTIRTEYPYQILKFWTAGSEHPALDLWITYVPIDKQQRQNHTYGLINVRKPGIPGLLNLLWPFIIWFTNGIFNEDRWVVEMEQAAFDAQGEDLNQEIFHVIQKVRALLIRHGLPMQINS